MSNILPEPTQDNPGAPVFNTIEPEKPQSPIAKRTMYILSGLVILALLCLAAGYTYDFLHNRQQDNTRKQDLSYISGVLSDYYDLSHFYPTLAQLNSSSFGAFAPSVDRSKFKDPSANSSLLSASPSDSHYAYQVGPNGCNDTTEVCTTYKLTAILTNSHYYSITNPVHKD